MTRRIFNKSFDPESLDFFMTSSFVVCSGALRDQYFWQLQRVHSNVFWNLSDYLAKVLLGLAILCAFVGYVSLLVKLFLFSSRPNRVVRLKKMIYDEFHPDEHISLGFSLIYFLMGGMMFGLPFSYVMFAFIIATGMGAAISLLSNTSSKSFSAESTVNQ